MVTVGGGRDFPPPDSHHHYDHTIPTWFLLTVEVVVDIWPKKRGTYTGKDDIPFGFILDRIMLFLYLCIPLFEINLLFILQGS